MAETFSDAAAVLGMPHILWGILQYSDPCCAIRDLPRVNRALNSSCKVAVQWCVVLDVSCHSNLSTASLINLVGGSTTLRVLKLPSCHHISDGPLCFQALQTVCPHLRHVFICGSPFALAHSPTDTVWGRLASEAVSVAAMLTRFAGICTLTPTPYVILATSRLFSVCNTMNLTDPAVQHNAWLLTVSVLAGLEEGKSLESFRIDTIVVCSLYAVSKLSGYYIHFNDIIREITHAIRRDATFAMALQHSTPTMQSLLASPVLHDDGSLQWESLKPNKCVAEWNYVLHCTPMTWEFPNLFAYLPPANPLEAGTPDDSGGHSPVVMPATQVLKRSMTLLPTDSLLSVPSLPPTPSDATMLSPPFHSTSTAVVQPASQPQNGLQTAIIAATRRLNHRPAPPPPPPRQPASHSPSRDSHADLTSPHAAVIAPILSPSLQALSLETPREALDEVSRKSLHHNARFRRIPSLQRELQVQQRLLTRERSISPEPRPRDPQVALESSTGSVNGAASLVAQPLSSSEAGFLAPRVRRKSTRITSLPFHPSELVVVTNSPERSAVSQPPTPQTDGDDDLPSLPASFHRQFSAPAAMRLFDVTARSTPPSRQPVTPFPTEPPLAPVREHSGESSGSSATQSTLTTLTSAVPELAHASSDDHRVIAATEPKSDADPRRTMSAGCGLVANMATSLLPSLSCDSGSLHTSRELSSSSHDAVPPVLPWNGSGEIGMNGVNSHFPPSLAPTLSRHDSSVSEAGSVHAVDLENLQDVFLAMPPPPPRPVGRLMRQETHIGGEPLSVGPPPATAVPRPPSLTPITKLQATVSPFSNSSLELNPVGEDAVMVSDPPMRRRSSRAQNQRVFELQPPPTQRTVAPSALLCGSGTVDESGDQDLDMIAFYNGVFVPHTRSLIAMLNDLAALPSLTP